MHYFHSVETVSYFFLSVSRLSVNVNRSEMAVLLLLVKHSLMSISKIEKI